MSSERLPGKVLKEVLERPLLEYELERLKRVQSVDEIIVATTVNHSDDLIAELCRRFSVFCFRGSEWDVLARFRAAARSRQADVVVRVSADCPLIDPEIVQKTLDFYLKNRLRYDYVSNILKRTYPRGMDCEVFSFQTLDETFAEAALKTDREHVTSFIYARPERYRLGGVTNDLDESHNRWTVDTQEDFDLIQKIISALYPSNPAFVLADILRLLSEKPEWRKINRHVRQKAG